MSSSTSAQSQSSIRSAASRGGRIASVLVLATVMVLAISVALFGLPYLAAKAAGGLKISILSAPNLVVDSNALSPSTYAPEVATVAGKFCNTGVTTLTSVMGYIGNYNGGSNSTPGIYPVRTGLDAGFIATYPWAATTDVYSLTHIGGRLGTMDAARYIGDLAPGECKYQYWTFGYPQTNPAHTSPVWGATNQTSDDLALRFDVWGTGLTGASDTSSFTVTMRNEISAMANKIQPNPSGSWFNTNRNQVLPGQLITSNGVLYSFGNINQGFDADNNFVPDFDAWMQPIGDKNYDPSCFRLVRTSGVLTITRNGGNPDYIYPFLDQLYFPNLPQDNTGGIGNVYYTFVALNGPCSTALSPYQEVASGSENEKFNGDFGASVPPPGGYTPAVTITKGGTAFVQLGGLITYTVKLKNTDPTYSAGLPMFGMPAVISDSIPPGTTLEPGSIVSDTSLTVLYSTDRGVSWSSVPPTPLSSVTTVQYWLNDPLAAGATVQVTFTTRMTTTPPLQPYVTNCADERFGSGAPFGKSCAITYLIGPYQGGHYTWRDENLDQIRQPATEPYLGFITTTLYYDLNGNSILDSSDPVISETATSSTGLYTFSNLYTGTYIVLVNKYDSDIPYGYRATTPITHLLTVSSTQIDYTLANFGFGPSLTMTKKLASPVYDGGYAYYGLAVKNLRPGGGDQVGNYCRYTVWASTQDVPNSGTGQKVWINPQNAGGAPDGLYAHAPFANASEKLAGTGWNLSVQQGTVISVDVILPIKVSNNTAGTVQVNVISATAGTVISTGTWNVSALGSGNWIIKNIAGPWSWADFNGSNRSIQLITKGGNTGIDFNLDSMGFYVYSNQPCATAATDDIMTVVPLTDTFDSTKLTFVSAVPTYTSMSIVSPTGVITWANIGPLAPGDSTEVKVTFLVSDVNVATPLTNYACTIGTTFSDGGFANNGCASVTKNITPTGYITGVVWNDVNLNNWQGTTGFDSSDFRIPGVNVTLFVCAYTTGASSGALVPTAAQGKACSAVGPGSDPTDWVKVADQVTDRNGGYEFTGLVDAWYAVVVDTTTIPNGFSADAAASLAANGSTGINCPPATCSSSWANDYVNQKLVAGYTNIQSASAITQVNFGYAGGAVIYGTIWQDYNGDGTHQSTDYGLDNSTTGVTVTLRRAGAVLSTTQTNANGYYNFPNLPAGTYSVTVNTGTLPTDGGTWTQTAEGQNWGIPCTGCSGVQTLTVSLGEVKGSYDFGYHRSGPVTIGDTVYYDWNGDGVQQPNEEGIPTVTLTLYRDTNGTGTLDGTDAVVSTTTTNSTGYYLFTGVPTSTAVVTYFVSVGTTGPTFPVRVHQTGDPDEPGTCQVCNDIGRAEVLNASILTMDFGYQPYGSGAIGDTVYKDMDGNGVQDGVKETGIPSVMVWLEVDLNDDGTYARVLTTTTNSSGYYLFSNLPDAKYRVVVDSASSSIPKDGYGKSYLPSTPTVVTTTIANANTFLDADFGFMPLGVIGDTIYWDANGNADKDRSEPGIPGVVVTLTTSTGTQVTTTDASGTYLFTGLFSGTYTVTVGPIPGNPTLTGDPDTNGTPCPSLKPGDLLYPYCDGKTTQWIITGTIFLGADFGYQPQGVIGDFVFQDLNGNGQQDSGEPGIPGIVVTVTNGSYVTTTTTDIDGRYSFSNLTATMVYTVLFQTPDKMISTVSSGAAITKGIGSVGTSVTVTLDGSGSVTNIGGNACTTCSLNIDSGFKLTGSYSVSGHVFFDAGNNGGIYTPTQPLTPDRPYADIVVYLYDSNNKLIGTTTTDATGTYTFTNVPGGGAKYTVSFDPSSPNLAYTTQTAWPGSLTKCGPCLNYYLPGFTVTTADVKDLDFGLYSQIDFGDLPDSYRTSLAANGARHVLTDTNNLYLGTPTSDQPDVDGNGAYAATNATGDNNSGSNDENGVKPQKGVPWLTGSVVTLTVEIFGNNGYLVGWFDWDRSGTFDPGEQVTFGSLVSGTHQVTLTLSHDYTTTNSVAARFRLYDGAPASPSYFGVAVGGEVEDYLWSFTPTAIVLATFDAQAAGPTPLIWVIVGALVLLAGFGAYRKFRRHGT